MYDAWKFADELVLYAERGTGKLLLFDHDKRIDIKKKLGRKDLRVLQLLLSESKKFHANPDILGTIWGRRDLGDESVKNVISKIRTRVLGKRYEELIDTTWKTTGHDGGYEYRGDVEHTPVAALPKQQNYRSSANKRQAPALAAAPEQDANPVPTPHQKHQGVPLLTDGAQTAEARPQLDTKPGQVEPAQNPPRARRSDAIRRRYLLVSVASLILMIIISTWLIIRAILVPPSKTVEIQVIVRQKREIRSPIVTDGAQLYFPECISERFKLARVNTNATEVESTPLKSDLDNPDLSDISPDGNSLLVRDVPRFVTDSAPFFVQPTDGRPASRLGKLHGLDGTWSRDGKHIYVGDRDKIYVANSDGTNEKVFLDGLKGQAFWLRWSPDGKTLRFSLIEQHLDSLWEVTLTDQIPRRIPLEQDHSDFHCCGNWTANGDYFFYQMRVKDVFQIWVRNEKTHELAPVQQQIDDSRGPVAGGNGMTVFARTVAPNTELKRYDPSSGSVTSLLTGTSVAMAAVSPDNQWIAYSTNPHRYLMLCKRDGSDKHPLAPTISDAVMPSWSPDGKQIAFMARPHNKWQVFVVSSAGGDAHPLLANDSHDTADPTWALDSQRLMIGYGGDDKKREPAGIVIVEVNSGSLQRVEGSNGMFSPRWSPDGTWIAALSADARTLWLFDQKHKWRAVLKDTKVGYPNWSPDGQFLNFLDTSGLSNLIKRLRIHDLQVDTVADLKDYAQPCPIFGNWIGLDGNAPLFIQDGSTHSIAAFRRANW